eukprot:jgi/Galph1/6026/GphlegSOOS_G4676.1
MTTEYKTLSQILQGTFSAQSEIRKYSESFLEEHKYSTGFLTCLLQTVQDDTLPLEVQLAAAIQVKNVIKSSWKNDSHSISIQDKSYTLENLVSVICRCSTKVQSPLADAFQILAREEFPHNWSSVVSYLIFELQNSQDLNHLRGALLLVRQLAKYFEYFSGREDHKAQENLLNQVTFTLFPILEDIARKLLESSYSEEVLELQKLMAKIFWSMTNVTIPTHLRDIQVFTKWFQLLLHMFMIPIPSTNEEDSFHMTGWKVKKWIGHIFLRMMQRYQDTSEVNDEEMLPFINNFIKAVAPQILQTTIELLYWPFRGLPLIARVTNLCISIVETSVSQPKLWKLLKPHLKDFMSSVIFPYLCFQQEDWDLWEQDPQAYIRESFDIIQEYLSARSAACSFVSTISTSKGFKTMEPFYNFCVEILQQYASMSVNSSDSHRKLTLAQKKDNDLVVRVRAVVDLQHLLEQDCVTEYLKCYVQLVLQHLFQLFGQIDQAELIDTLESLIDKFSQELSPYALEIIERLRDAFLVYIARIEEAKEPSEEDDELSLSVIGYLNGIDSMLETVENQITVLESISNALIVIFEGMFKDGREEFLEETLMIIESIFIYSKTVFPYFWSLYPKLFQCMDNQCNFASFSDSIASLLECYIRYGTKEWLTLSSEDNIPHQQRTKNFISFLLSRDTLIDQEAGLELLGTLLRSCKESLREELLYYLDVFISYLRKTQANEKKMTTLQTAVFSSFLYQDAKQTFSLLIRAGILQDMMTLWLLSIKDCESKRDSKLFILATCELLIKVPSETFGEYAPLFSLVASQLIQVIQKRMEREDEIQHAMSKRFCEITSSFRVHFGIEMSTKVVEENKDSLYPIAVLIDELKNEDMQLRLNSIKRLGTIASALGPERTRAELLPFLSENIDDEDEVLLALAEQLGNFVDAVGGPSNAYCLLDLLETLAAVEETVVREKAVESLSKLVEIMAEAKQSDDIVKYYVPLVKRLAKGDWFTSRISAAGLFYSAYKYLPEDLKEWKKELRSIFRDLSQDETPMVRRAAASKLAKFATVVEVECVEKEIIPIFVRLAADEQDSVRLLAVENCAVLAKLIPLQSPARQEYLIPITRELAADKSWRVRFMFADKICELAEGLGFEATVKELAPAFYQLIEDCEAEVRTAAAFKIAALFETISRLDNKMTDSSSVVSEVFEKLYSYSRNLSLDDSPFVRSALASNIMSVAPIAGPEITRDTLLRMFLKLLQDDFSEVRLNIIGSLDKVSQVIGIDKLASDLLPSVVELSEDRNWRIRYAAIELTPTLAKQLGKEYFESDKKLGILCIQWLSDSVYAIRELAITNLKSLTELFGQDWATKHVVPSIVALYKSSKNYLYRMTALHAMACLSSVLPADVSEQVFVPLLVEEASQDPVANIRFGAAKTLQETATHIKKETVKNEVIPCLEKLKNNMEEDSDVRYYANQSLIALQAL